VAAPSTGRTGTAGRGMGSGLLVERVIAGQIGACSGGAAIGRWARDAARW
jgi:hypothetical protein